MRNDAPPDRLVDLRRLVAGRGERKPDAGDGSMLKKRYTTPSLAGRIASAQATHKAPPVSLPTLRFTKKDE